ncbi:MAG TPA: EAL domain-containing protein, partial [Burkholderiales bacterium]|nr:EAL domain-containing protein [Burkholderiales bacterium]
DLVISDFSMPQFSGPKALAIARESRGDIPFIFISGTIGENVAVDMMKAGADDYVMKNNLARLVPALERELREAGVRRGRRLAEEGLRESESRFRQLIEQASDGIFVTDKEGNFTLVNSRYCEMLGYSRAELLQLHSEVTYPEGEREERRQHRAEARERKTSLYERMIRRRDGSSFPAEVNITLLDNDNIQGIVRDITERKKAQQALVMSEAGLRRAQLMAKIAHVVTGPDGSFERWSDTLPQLIGVEPAQMPRRTRDWLDLVHPDDRERFRATAIEAARTGTRKDVEYRLRRADGEWIHVRQVIEPHRSQADAEGATRWFSTLQDVTEHRLAEAKIHHLNRVYAVLSGINALIVRVRDRDELFQGACRIAVEAGQFPMVWVGVVDRETKRVKPIAWGGEAEEFLASAPLSMSQSRAVGRGMSGSAIDEKKAMIANDIQNDPRTQMKEQCKDRGISSLVMLPLVVQGEGTGVLALYASEVGFFDDEEMKLLLELAGDISFALDHIAKAEKLDYLAYYDSLTGLANRSLFHERLVQYVSAAQSEESRLAVAVVDVDRFKIINDSLGRQAGDELLRQIAHRIEGHAGPIRMARINADRFAIVRTGVSSESEVARLIEQWLAECFGPPYAVTGTELRVSAKAGIALFPNDGADADALFQNAEAALKKAKATGERYLFHTQQMTERIGENLALENKLRQALEKEEFVLHYQPKVDTATRRIDSVEALIRWQSPELGLVPPMQFIPLLEETGLILEVGAWALRRAVVDHRTWTEQGLPAPRISVNVSAVQLRKRDFVATVEEAIKAGSVPPGIDLEITEGLVMEDIEANMRKLEAVRVLGVSIAIDDFGTGYSSLGWLAKLPVHSLKIDRSFIITMVKDPAIMTLVSTIISMAHSLRLKVVAEGVDAEEQAKALDRLGCDQLQGYLFSKPVPFDDMTALLGSKA